MWQWWCDFRIKSSKYTSDFRSLSVMFRWLSFLKGEKMKLEVTLFEKLIFFDTWTNFKWVNDSLVWFWIQLKEFSWHLDNLSPMLGSRWKTTFFLSNFWGVHLYNKNNDLEKNGSRLKWEKIMLPSCRLESRVGVSLVPRGHCSQTKLLIQMF